MSELLCAAVVQLPQQRTQCEAQTAQLHAAARGRHAARGARGGKHDEDTRSSQEERGPACAHVRRPPRGARRACSNAR